VIREAADILPAEESFIVHCVEAEWVHPADPLRRALDETDMARLRLILDLKSIFGANDESIPLILHLLDQLHTLHDRMSARRAG
jgi:chaperone modulatory protein CbpM